MLNLFDKQVKRIRIDLPISASDFGEWKRNEVTKRLLADLAQMWLDQSQPVDNLERFNQLTELINMITDWKPEELENQNQNQ